MNRHRVSLLLIVAFALATGCIACSAQEGNAGSAEDRASLAKTGDAIRAAFASGDVDAIMAYHHPDVVKALSPDGPLVDRNALKAYLEKSFQSTQVAFKENHVENTIFLGDSAVEISTFTIQGTPKTGGAPFLFKGRAMVVYVRYKQSPTGWASIREVVQPTP
jgi:ketosteroid isomerase-like protein